MPLPRGTGGGVGATAGPSGRAEGQRQPGEQELAAALRSQREELLAAINAQGQQLRDEAAQRTQALKQRLAALELHWQDGSEAAAMRRATRDSQPAGAPAITAEPASGEAAAFGVAAGTGRAGRGGRPPDRSARGGAAAGR